MPKKSDIDSLLTELNEKFTPDDAERPVVVRGSDMPATEIIPCESPALGYVLGRGGWPKGKLIEFFGKEHSGKTTLMMKALQDVWEYHNREKAIAILDVEHKLNEDWARLIGFPYDEAIISTPPNAEKATDIMHHLIRSKQVCAIGFDSIAAAAPWKEQETFEEKEHVPYLAAKVMTRNVKTVAPMANLYGVTCFYTNQLRDDIEGYHRLITPGGRAVKFQMSQRIYIRNGKEKYTVKTSDGPKEVGYPMVFKAVKNGFGPRNREGYADFYWESSHWYEGIGFNIDADLLRLGTLVGLVTRAGPYYSWTDFKEKGRDNFFEAVEKAGQKEELLSGIRERLVDAHQSMDAKSEGIIPVGPDIDEEP